MDEAQKLKDRLQASVDFAIEQKEDMDVSNWNYQEGILLTPNEAKLVIDLVKKLTIPVVVGQSEQLAEHECKFYVNAEWTALSCECGKRIKPKG